MGSQALSPRTAAYLLTNRNYVSTRWYHGAELTSTPNRGKLLGEIRCWRLDWLGSQASVQSLSLISRQTLPDCWLTMARAPCAEGARNNQRRYVLPYFAFGTELQPKLSP